MPSFCWQCVLFPNYISEELCYYSSWRFTKRDVHFPVSPCAGFINVIFFHVIWGMWICRLYTSRPRDRVIIEGDGGAKLGGSPSAEAYTLGSHSPTIKLPPDTPGIPEGGRWQSYVPHPPDITTPQWTNNGDTKAQIWHTRRDSNPLLLRLRRKSWPRAVASHDDR